MQLTYSQRIVLRALSQVGDVDDGILADRAHHLADLSSSGVRTRRVELVRLGFIEAKGTKKLKSGRVAVVWGLTSSGRRAVKRIGAKEIA